MNIQHILHDLFVLNKLVLVYGFGLKSVSCISTNASFGTNLVTMAIKIYCECLLYCMDDRYII